MMTRSPLAFFPFRAASSQVSQGPAPRSGPTRICPRGPTPPGLPGTPGLGTGSPMPWQIFLFQLAVTLGCRSPGFAAFPGPEPGSWATGLPSSPAGLTSGDTGRVISFRPGAEIAQAPASSAVSPGPQICRSLPPGTLRRARKIPQQRSSTRGGGVSRGGPRPSLCLGVASCSTGQGRGHLRPGGTDLGDPDSAGWGADIQGREPAAPSITLAADPGTGGPPAAWRDTAGPCLARPTQHWGSRP